MKIDSLRFNDDDTVDLHFVNEKYRTRKTIEDLPIADIIEIYDAVFPSDSELEKFNLPSSVYMLQKHIETTEKMLREYKALVALANGLSMEELQAKLDEKLAASKTLDELVKLSKEIGLYDD